MLKQSLYAEAIFTISDLLTPLECEQHIREAEALGFDEAPLGGDSRDYVFKQVRSNTRVIRDDTALSATMWQRVADFMPADWFGYRATGLNDRWRYYRYDPGERFAPHTDGSYSRDNGEESQFTLLVYLNEGYEGGTTNFHLSKKNILKVVPRTGMAVVFAHRQLHEGAAVLKGRKYALRTDVMFARKVQASST